MVLLDCCSRYQIGHLEDARVFEKVISGNLGTDKIAKILLDAALQGKEFRSEIVTLPTRTRGF